MIIFIAHNFEWNGMTKNAPRFRKKSHDQSLNSTVTYCSLHCRDGFLSTAK